MLQALTDSLKRMAVLQIVLKKQLDEYVALLLTGVGRPDTPENYDWAVAELVKRCKELTEKETSPGAGTSTRPNADLLSAYAFARYRLELTMDPVFCDGRRSFDFFIGSAGVGPGAVARLAKSVAGMEEFEVGAPLIEMGWMSEDGARKPWPELFALESFTLKLREAGEREVVLLREHVGCAVQMYKTAVFMMARRSIKPKALARQQRVKKNMVESVTADLHKLDTWAKWTPSGGIEATPPQPPQATVIAALDEKFPWGAGEGGDGLAGLLPAVRVTLAKSRSNGAEGFLFFVRLTYFPHSLSGSTLPCFLCIHARLTNFNS